MNTKVPSYMIGSREITIMSYKHENYRLKLIYLESKFDFGYLVTVNRRKMYYTVDLSLAEGVYFNLFKQHIDEVMNILNLEECDRLQSLYKSI